MAGAVNITFGAIIAGFQSGVGQMATSVANLSQQINGNLAASYAVADRNSRFFNRGLGRLADDLQSFGRKASIVSAGIALIGASSFKSYANINALQLGLENITGSAAGAEARFKELMPVIKLPGLGLEEAIKGDVRLQAVGFSAVTAKNALLQFGNAIALTGGGKFELDSVITQLTQMGSKARVLSEDLKPIVNASPAVAKAIKEMFGTVDSEQISAKLQAAGRGPQDFIQDLIAKLSQLERVTGGPKNALENFGDSVKLAEFELGKAADKAFGFTNSLNSLGDFIGKAVEGFGELSTGTQRGILAVTGFTAALGPLSIAVGTALRILPVLATGFTALLSPVALVVAAVATLGVAAVSIYNFDKAIVSSYSSAKLLADAHTAVSQAVGAETGRLSALLLIAKDESKSKEIRRKAIADINAISPEYLGNISLETINLKSATGAIQDYTKALTLKASANYYSNKLAESQARLAKENQTALEDRTSAFDKLAANATSIGAYFGKYDAAEDKLREKQKERAAQAQYDAAKEVDFNQRNLNLIIEQQAKLGIKTTPIQPFDYSSTGGDSAIKKLKDQLKEAKESVESYKAIHPGAIVPAELLARYTDLRDRVKAATSATTKQREEHTKSLSVVEHLESALKLVNQEIQEKRALGLTVPPEVYHEVDNITSAIRRLKGEEEIDLRLKPGGISLINQNMQGAADRIATFTEALKTRLDVDFISEKLGKLQAKIQNLGVIGIGASQADIASLQSYNKQLDSANQALQKAQRLAEDSRVSALPKIAGVQIGGFKIDVFDDSAKTLEDRTAQLGSSIQNSLQSAAASAAEGMGELIGGMLAGTAQLSDIPKAIGSVFANLAKTMGQSLIAFGTAGLAAKVFVSNPLTAIVAGIGLVALGSALQATMQKQSATAFAQGGLVTGATYALIGEGRGTSKNNPEVVAPLDKLKGMIGGNGSTQVFIPDIMLEGDMIRIALNRSEANNYYTR